MMRFKAVAILSFLVALPLAAEEPVRTNGEDLGITIMGQIVQKDEADNVALIKESSGTVRAVKKDHVIADKYKVLLVTGKFIEVLTRDGKRYQIYQNKFAGEVAGKSKEPSPGPQLSSAGKDYYQEEGFERRKDKITMTAMYRDKLVKEDLAKVLMQATAEPYMEGGQIVGFKLSQIDAGSIYDKAGLMDGDVVTSINGQELNSIAGSIALLKSLKNSDSVDVVVRRGGSTINFAIAVQ